MVESRKPEEFTLIYVGEGTSRDPEICLLSPNMTLADLRTKLKLGRHYHFCSLTKPYTNYSRDLESKKTLGAMKNKRIGIKAPEKKKEAQRVDLDEMRFLDNATFADDISFDGVSARRASFQKKKSFDENSFKNLSALDSDELKALFKYNECNYGINLLTGEPAELPLFTLDFDEDEDEVLISTRVEGVSFQDWFSNASLLEVHKKGYHVGEAELNVSSYFQAKGAISYSNTSSNQKQSESETLYMEHYIPKGCCTFRTIKEHLSDDFENFFSERAITKNNVAEFFNIFGHVIGTRIVFGGKLTSQTTYTKSELKDVKKSELEGRISAALNTYLVSAKGGYTGGKSKDERTASSEVHETAKISNIGGIPEKAGDASEWLESLANDSSYWQPIKICTYKSTLDFLDEEIKEKILSLMGTSKPLELPETLELETGIYKITNMNTGCGILDGVERETESLGIFGLAKTKAGYLIHNPKTGGFLFDDPSGNFVGSCSPKVLSDSAFWVLHRDPENLLMGYRIRNSKSNVFLSDDIIESPDDQGTTISIPKKEISKISENCIRWKFELVDVDSMKARIALKVLQSFEALYK